MNRQLIELRTERLNLQQGALGLKSAITNISHDLRTPLTAICGYLDLLEQRLVGFYGVFTNKNIRPNIQMSETRVMRRLDKAAFR